VGCFASVRLIGRPTRLLRNRIVTCRRYIISRHCSISSPRWFPRSLARISSTLRPIRHIMQMRGYIMFCRLYINMRFHDTFLNASPYTAQQLHSAPSPRDDDGVTTIPPYDTASGPTSLLLCI